MSKFKRELLPSADATSTAGELQKNLVELINLSLLLKQAHWNVVGPHFRALHLQLDEIIVTVRAASDEVAERIAALGIAPDGRSSTIATKSEIEEYPETFLVVKSSLSLVADALKTTIDSMRSSLSALGETDPISEDLTIGTVAQLEKHLWMLQAQEC